jgi:glycolate oxidase iron-sulfur subunit
MQTRFSPAQLERPEIRAADSILRSCVHCGFCTATCPTYQILGDELDGPRGRIYLIKNLLEEESSRPGPVLKHLDRCLTCSSCMTTCPSGVDYAHLLDIGRARLERSRVRPWPMRVLRAILAFVLSRPLWLRIGVGMGRLLAPLAAWFPVRLRTALILAAAPVHADGRTPVATRSRGRPTLRLLPGCVQQVLGGDVNDATRRVLETCGFEVRMLAETPCCGAVEHHLGQLEATRKRVLANVRRWSGDRESPIVVNASGCGTMLKDYGYLLALSPAADAARSVSARARDVSEILGEADWERHLLPARVRLRVAYHGACSLQHGQKITDLPRRLLERIGHVVVPIPDGHLCCGAAGTYPLFEPELSAELGRRKAEALAALGVDVVATGNLGCMLQLRRYSPLPFVHTVQLVDWACGGPRPARLGPTLTIERRNV